MEHTFIQRFLKTSPHFDLPVDLPSGNFATYAIEAADVNNDGFPENKLRNLPSSLASLPVLRTLDVSYNLLSSAEDHVFQLTSLQYLGIFRN